MKISTCIIVKNEESNLKKILNIIKDFSDEVIIVDTGSKDKTCQIAKQYNINLYSYQWNDDFSAAKNFALSKAKGDYIFFPDADEFLQIKNKKLFIEFLNQNVFDFLLIKIINIDKDKDNQYIDEFFNVRLWKNKKEFRFVNKIHENLVDIEDKKIKIGILPENIAYILHTGYSSSLIQEKSKRNLKSLLQIPENERNGAILAEIAEAYNALNDKKNALYFANQSIKKGIKNSTNATKPYRIMINLLEEEKQGFKVIEQAILLAILDFPQMPDFYAEYAKLLANDRQYQDAIKFLSKAIELKAQYKGIEKSNLSDDLIVKSKKLIDEWKKIIKIADEVKISACIIVKNEEKNIERWFNSIKDCSDEQIVVDTGSNDNTLKIANELPVKLYHYKWHDDFAAARNFALSKAKLDWVIFLDADEYFDEESIKKIKYIIAKAVLLDKNVIFSLEIDLNDKGKSTNIYKTVRIFKNIFSFGGKIHETIQHQNKAKMLEVDDIFIYHTGYADDKKIKEKAKKYLDILLKLAKTNNEKLYHYIAQCYYQLEDYKKAKEYLEEYFNNSDYTIINGEAYNYISYINCLIKLKTSPKILEEVIVKAINKFPHIPDFYGFLGILYYENKKYNKAYILLNKSLEVFKKEGVNSREGSNFLSSIAIVKEVLSKLEIN